MANTPASPLQEALELVESLSPEDQLTLIELVSRRLIELKRIDIARNAEATLKTVREGKARFGSVDDLKNDLLNPA